MLSKHFDHQAAEQLIYRRSEQSGAFAADPGSGAEPFTIVIPPPNVTGSLHVGHALDGTLQDILIRSARMRGRDALWMPGTDHAGIATQLMVERELAAEGSSGRLIGRDAFIDRVWRWKREHGGAITQQFRRLGASLDWARERFTMDEGLSAAVRETFVRLHRDGLIYRDRRLVNWDPSFRTAISDLEVESREVRGHLWHVRYEVEGGRSITVATTRPETMLGDTAIAVNPADARYADLLGRTATVPLVGRRVPIIADSYSDPDKGTGAVKITPAHDFNDFAVGQRHGLAMPTILDSDGTVTLGEIADELGPGATFVRSLEGATREDARTRIVAELDQVGALVGTEPHVHPVPHAERGGAVIEPRLTEQWYCDTASLAGPAIRAVESGRTVFQPRQWENTFFSWLRDIQPWCISRQLWWGHRIPAWYAPDGTVFVAHDEAEALEAARARFGRDVPLEQDPDVLDTWFSSALWPFSTLGWPDATSEFRRYYPTDVLVTGFDIIFFWVARMMMMGLHLTGEVPFRMVVIHGLVRDERGQKMSKSKGNGIDPLDLIEQYGADALRFTVAALTGPGRDIKLGAKRVEEYRAFVTKLWNAARFLEMNGAARPASFDGAPFDGAALRSPLGRWIVAESNDAIGAATEALDLFRFDEYAAVLYRFTWNVFCDWFLELSKPALAEDAELRAVAAHVFGIVLRLLHPVMPFVTEELAGTFGHAGPDGLVRSAWPAPLPVADPEAAKAELGWVMGAIGAVRTVRATLNIPPGSRLPLLLREASAEAASRARDYADAFNRMARVETIATLDGPPPPGSAQAPLADGTLVLPLAGIIDLRTERARLAASRDRAASEAGKLELKLGRADFVERAKPDVVADTRDRLQASRSEAARLDAALEGLR